MTVKNLLEAKTIMNHGDEYSLRFNTNGLKYDIVLYWLSTKYDDTFAKWIKLYSSTTINKTEIYICKTIWSNNTHIGSFICK